MDKKFSSQQIVAIYDTHTDAATAVHELKKAGFDMRDVSVVALHPHGDEMPIGYIDTGMKMVSWGKYGGFWGAAWGLMLGSAMIFVPGFGMVVVAGWFASALAGTLEGAIIGGGLGALAAAFSDIGLPKHKAEEYHAAVKAGKYVLIVKHAASEAEKAKEILGASGAGQVDVHE